MDTGSKNSQEGSTLNENSPPRLASAKNHRFLYSLGRRSGKMQFPSSEQRSGFRDMSMGGISPSRRVKQFRSAGIGKNTTLDSQHEVSN